VVSGPGHLYGNTLITPKDRPSGASVIATVSGLHFTLVLTESGQVEKYLSPSPDDGDNDPAWDPNTMIEFQQDPSHFVYDITAGKYHAAMLVLGHVHTGYKDLGSFCHSTRKDTERSID